ncbi:MAG TPA: LysR family transcriptional regulator [Candidatus Acidoferrum sp.]|nr:LysR family transcriptional regulator [Candidatus Acidoferrum sp.]
MGEHLPSLEALRCFSEAARLLNFRAAARAVGLTPAALGQRIRQLEEMLDAKLFHRTTRTVTLTEEGLALLPFAHRTLDAAAECVRAGRGEVGPPPMELTLGTRHELGISWLVPLLPRLRRAQPGLTVHTYFGSGPDLVHRVRTLQIDCAVTSSVLTDPKLDAVRLHEERYVFVGAPRLVRRTPFDTRKDAARHTLIDITPDLALYRYFRNGSGANDLQFARVLRMGTIAAIRHLVLRGEGVAVLPEYFVGGDLESERLTRLMTQVQLQSDYFRLVFRGDDPRRTVYERMADAMLLEPLK